MKDIYKNPTLYYILVPALVALWPLLVWAVYLPRAEHSYKDELVQCAKAEKIMMHILDLDENRLKLADANETRAEFHYATAVEKIARLCEISSKNYKLRSGRTITPRGQKSQSANIVLENIDITRFAKFLSLIQLRWTNLQCTKLKLTKKKDLPDTWKIVIDFKYYY